MPLSPDGPLADHVVGPDGDPGAAGTEPLATVVLDLADDPNLVRLARLTVSGVASVGGLGLDESEQCRAAVDEMCSTLLEGAPPGARLRLNVVTDGVTVEVHGVMPRDQDRPIDPTRERLGRLILDATVDAWKVDADGDTSRFWFRVGVDAASGQDRGEADVER